MKTNKWNESLSKGEKAEKTFETYMEGKTTFSVQNVSKDSEWQSMGVDYLIFNPEGNTYQKAEVKAGVFSVGTVVIEIYDNLEKKHKGWFFTCKADVLYWTNDILLIGVQWEPFRQWFERNRTTQYCKRFKNESSWYNGIAHSLCYTVDLSALIAKEGKPDWLIEYIEIPEGIRETILNEILDELLFGKKN